VELFTLLGTPLKYIYLEDYSASLDLSGMNNGIYFLKVYPESGAPFIKRILMLN
jgi:hypothetical protein